MKFKDQIVFITGSTRGIGKAIALAFAKEGGIPIIIGRDKKSAVAVAQEIAADGGQADGFGCDVTNMQSVQETVNKILDKHKRVDILVNNAGITKDNLLLRMSEDDWDRVMQVNLRGVFNCTKVLSKVMLKQASAKGGSASGGKNGRIINITSIIGILGNAGQANYAASKAGIIGFTKSIAREFASRGITANSIAPGYIMTDMTDQLKEEAKNAILKNIPLGRLGQTSDITGVCLFLASEEANYITGQTIVVDGGMAI